MGLPYFYAKEKNGRVETRGTCSCFLGHKIDHTPGQRSDGIYAGWSWDGQRLIVENDRYGFYPLFYYCRDGEICLSPSIPQILSLVSQKSFDYTALSVFLRLGFFIGDDSPFTHIKAMPPDVAFKWEGGSLEISGRYARQKPITISKDEAVERYTHLFRQAIQRRLPQDDHFVIPLSSGRDSRHILLELHHQGYKPEFCVTSRKHFAKDEDDIRIAGMLTASLGIKHVVLDQNNDFFKDNLRNITLTNYCALEGAWMHVMAEYLKSHTQTIYDGIAGDTLSEGNFNIPRHAALFRSESYSELAEEILNFWHAMDEEAFKIILRKGIYQKICRETAAHHLKAELQKHVHAANPLGAFYFWNRTRRIISLCVQTIYKGIKNIQTPYLDHDLYDFLAALPGEFFMNQKIHTDTILKAYPQCSKIPFHSGNAAPPKIQSERIKYTRNIVKHFFTRRLFRPGMLKRTYLVPRMARSLISRDYCRSLEWIRPTFLLYLMELGILN
ncbi:MAG: hypothetical protein A2Y04_04710 [Omnitrophica WOR_2 bacterium GWC2_45_7]|nr:MAG: hypothetical protein A2Z81_08785 [Omnitrophica WOR_2 bacterium GWA2_45_18]OGX18982.1 MAG: hypothetical protein A2Y04_04710 [Omnitrophica WOR_2 bacterium GWC2_45_7]